MAKAGCTCGGVHIHIHIHTYIYTYTLKCIPDNHTVSQVHGTTIAITITTTNQKKTSFVPSPPEVWRRTEYRIIQKKGKKRSIPSFPHSLIPRPPPPSSSSSSPGTFFHIHIHTPPPPQTSRHLNQSKEHTHTHTPVRYPSSLTKLNQVN